MNDYAMISLAAFMVCFFLGNFIYHKNSRNNLNRMVAILCILVGILAFIEFQYRQAPDLETAYYWLKISTIWPLVPSVLLHISLIFTGQKNILKHKTTYILIYFPAILIAGVALSTNLLLDGANQEYWGWTYNFPQNPILFNIMSLWTIVAGFTAATLCFIYYLKAKNMKRLQAKYMLAGLYFPLIISIVSDLVLPTVAIRVPEMTMTMSTVGISFISYGIWKYRFPALTSAIVADRIVSTMSNFLLLLDQNKKIVNMNQATIQIFGYEKEDLVGKPVDMIFARKEDAEIIFEKKKNKDYYSVNSISNKESILQTKNKTKIPVILSISPIIGDLSQVIGLVLIGSDIKDLKKAENKIKDSLEEKEVLLQEVHHRVKNNLQIISSLLNLQTKYIQNKEDLDLFRESQSRVKSMAIIHELLYQSSDFAHIDFKEYISSLVAYLFHYYSVDPQKIKLKLNVDNLMLGMETAIPCGLIVNELVSNSLKYAFPPGCDGEINIHLHSENGHFLLEVEDTGIGLPEKIDFENSETLGLRLVMGLIDQINGRIEHIAGPGTKYQITFCEVAYRERI
jgi:PAS domain S-box-containing protein